MNILIFDTETTGLLKPDNAPLEDQPKIIEFYGVLINEEFQMLEEVNELIYPGEPITQEITKITGIKNSDLEGKPSFSEVSEDIINLFNKADLVVAHNAAFDEAMVDNELKRIGLERNKGYEVLCTVEALKKEYGFRISLSALYKRLFNTFFKAHRAKDDVFALVKCFHNLTESGVINLELYKDRV